MEFTIYKRMKLYKTFYKDVNNLLKKTKNIQQNAIPGDIYKLYETKKIAQGAEGTVYLTHTKNIDGIIIKQVNLQDIFEKKGLSKNILNKNPFQIYELFYEMKKNISMPSLIETICYSLTNQLVFQNICPHFGLNYYWEYSDNKIIYYNEYANYSTLFNWAKVSRSKSEWMNILVQIIISIISMQKYFNIIHGDLHSLNILIYKVTAGGYWKYMINKKKYIIPNLGWIVLISDFGFATIPNKVYIKWYYDDVIKKLSIKQRVFFDFNYLSDDLLKQNQPVKDILKETLKITVHTNTNRNAYTLIDLLNYYYKEIDQPQKIPSKFIETYNLDKKFIVDMLPNNFSNLVVNWHS